MGVAAIVARGGIVGALRLLFSIRRPPRGGCRSFEAGERRLQRRYGRRHCNAMTPWYDGPGGAVAEAIGQL